MHKYFVAGKWGCHRAEANREQGCNHACRIDVCADDCGMRASAPN